MKVDHRKHKRRPIEGDIDIKIKEERASHVVSEEAGLVAGVLYDISKSGVGIRSTFPIDAGTTVLVKRIKLVTEETGSDMPGTVAWIKAMGNMYGIGISFEREVNKENLPDLN